MSDADQLAQVPRHHKPTAPSSNIDELADILLATACDPDLIPKAKIQLNTHFLKQALGIIDGVDSPKNDDSTWRTRQSWNERKELKAELRQAFKDKYGSSQ